MAQDSAALSKLGCSSAGNSVIVAVVVVVVVVVVNWLEPPVLDFRGRGGKAYNRIRNRKLTKSCMCFASMVN